VELRRLRAGEWLAGAGGALLIVSLFLPWYAAATTTLSGYDGFPQYAEKTNFVDATRLATALLGNSIGANIFMVGYAYQLGSLPLGDNFEAFGRAGIERSWLDQPPGDGFDLSGNGFLVGAGFEYKLDALIHHAASVFVDYNIHRVEMESVRFPVSQTTGSWGLGATIGF